MPDRVWIPVAAVVLACGYLPTLAAPFDFIDDGNLVYPAPAGTTFAGHVDRWWDRVRANYDHLGPFRPTLWAHWETAAALCDGDPRPWRAWRLAWCGLSAGMLLWLLRELKVRPLAAVLAAAAAMWNPYRNEIWTSLTLGEGVAMPYALFALVAARRAAASPRPLAWDLASAAAVLMALGCKNVFAALVPAQLALRVLADGVPVREALRRHGRRAAALSLTLLLPVAHYAYFRLNWHPGQYETTGPTLDQAARLLRALKGAVGLDFLGVGLLLTAIAITLQSPRIAMRELPTSHRPALLAAVLLLAAGFAVYLPLGMMSGRYTMPAVWGLDIAIGLVLTLFVALPASAGKRLAWAGLTVGVVALAVVNVARQEKLTARSRLLWQAVEYVEATAPPGAAIEWAADDALNAEEGIHFAWHLKHRGRPDIAVGLADADGRPLSRVELPPPGRPPLYRVSVGPAAGWEPERAFAAADRFGRKRFAVELARRPNAGEPTVIRAQTGR
jgi:hypothetical protein